MAGLNAPQGEPLKNPDQFDETISAEFAADLKQRMSARLPVMANARFMRGHAGLYDMTRDGRAIIGKIREIHGLTVAVGFSGTGLALAPAVGQVVSDLVTDGETRLVDLTPFQPERFGK
jgi:glycine/D-amino acid oxidase-like deaminating enzyme